jgi:hypothetical protein
MPSYSSPPSSKQDLEPQKDHTKIFTMLAALTVVAAWLLRVSFAQSGSCPAVTQHLPDPPYDNFFYSDCNVDAQAIITSPLTNSNLSVIGPRLVVAWPAGNSGICTFFQPQDGPNGTLAIELVNSTVGTPLAPVHQPRRGSDYPYVGVQGVIAFNSSATLTVPILGSVRTIRDFTEGPSLLYPVIQDGVNVSRYNGTGATFTRLWLDNVTISNFSMVPFQNEASNITINRRNKTISFGAGFYHFQASFSYPQLTQLPPQDVLNDESQALITQFPSQATSLSFLSYTEKLLAGAWRFLTYFARDSMIAALLLEDVLSTGNASATEAVIGAVLERINRTDGSVCHEETLGDYATYLHLQENVTSTAPIFVYPMIDTDFYLPVIMSRYFSTHPGRVQPLLSKNAGSIDRANRGLTYGELALIGAEKIMNTTAAFAQSQTRQNLIHLKSKEIVGEWRDSTFGLGGGRIPFDVNAALVPAALRAIAELANMTGIFPDSTPYSNWSTIAASRAQIWEDETLQFFEVSTPVSQARNRLNTFVSDSSFYNGPTHANSLPASGNITTYSLALQGYNNLSSVNAEHSDTSFRLFFLNSTNDDQLTPFINATANSLNRPFPAGLLTPVGMVVANPALSGQEVLTRNFTNAAYHGTVVWSWTLAMMAKGLERQIARCNETTSTDVKIPAFCDDTSVFNNVVLAYNNLWDVIEDNTAQLQSEVWSWTYGNETGYQLEPLGALPAPPGVGGSTESNVRQLWSLTFLAVKRDETLK